MLTTILTINDMEKDKKDTNCWCKVSIAVILALVLWNIGSWLLALDNQASTIWCKRLIMLLFVICSVLVCCGISCHNKISKITDEAITEEKIKRWVKESVNESTEIKADSILDSQLGTINQNISKLNESLHEDLQDVLLTKNTKLKFLQEMAHSIGKDGSAWQDGQVKRFMLCLDAITKTSDKEAKQSDGSDVKTSKSEPSNKSKDCGINTQQNTENINDGK